MSATRNCQAGDWAICLGPLHRGRVVRCIRWLGKVEGWKRYDRWETDKFVVGVKKGLSPTSAKLGDETYSYPDSLLQPVRGTFEEILAQVTAFRMTMK